MTPARKRKEKTFTIPMWSPANPDYKPSGVVRVSNEKTSLRKQKWKFEVGEGNVDQNLPQLLAEKICKELSCGSVSGIAAIAELAEEYSTEARPPIQVSVRLAGHRNELAEIQRAFKIIEVIFHAASRKRALTSR